MLCLNATTRKRAPAASCRPPATPTTPTRCRRARTKPPCPSEGDDVTIGVLSRLTNALNTAARAHAIPGRSADLPDRVRGAERAQPRTRRLARPAGPVRRDRRAHRLEQPARGGVLAVPAQGRPARRARPGRASTAATIGFQTGLETVAGRPKPLYSSWPLPLTVTKHGHGFSLWGLVRPATGCDQG